MIEVFFRCCKCGKRGTIYMDEYEYADWRERNNKTLLCDSCEEYECEKESLDFTGIWW